MASGRQLPHHLADRRRHGISGRSPKTLIDLGVHRAKCPVHRDRRRLRPSTVRSFLPKAKMTQADELRLADRIAGYNVQDRREMACLALDHRRAQPCQMEGRDPVPVMIRVAGDDRPGRLGQDLPSSDLAGGFSGPIIEQRRLTQLGELGSPRDLIGRRRRPRRAVPSRRKAHCVRRTPRRW